MDQSISRRTLSNHPLVHQVRRTIEQYHLIKDADERPLIIALSGGADSTALLRVLFLLGYPIVAAHCNFHLRGEESDRDEAFVQDLCRSLDVPLHSTHFDTMGYVQATPQTSIEMAARRLRYRYFDQLYEELSAQAIVLGHHLEDNVEQLLINLTRGSGIRGLRGILPDREEGKYIRPMIDCDPALIYDFLESAHQPYVTDSTNRDTSIRRNYLRHEIRPLFDRLNPSFGQAVGTSIHYLRELEQIYDAYLRDTLPEGESLSITWLRQQIAPLSILHEAFGTIGLDRETLAQMLRDLDQPTPATYHGSNGIVERYRGDLIPTHQGLLDRMKLASQTRIALPPPKEWREHQVVEHPLGRLWLSLIDRSAASTVKADPSILWLDYDKLLAHHTELSISSTIDDRLITPWGLGGRKKRLSKILRDKHILPSKRQSIPVLEDNHRELLWVAGVVRSMHYPIDASTRRIARIQWLEA